MQRRYLYHATLLIGLAVVQLAAEIGQVSAGFVPFSNPPVRVPFSWDMFAVRIDRCAISWDPPLEIEGRPIARWQDRLPALEFDSIRNVASDYDDAALFACAYRTHAPTTATVSCALHDGTLREQHLDCP
jgi:hypothetical protein